MGRIAHRGWSPFTVKAKRCFGAPSHGGDPTVYVDVQTPEGIYTVGVSIADAERALEEARSFTTESQAA